MKYLFSTLLALVVATGVYACAEGEVWQSDISHEQTCTEYTQVHTGHKLGIKTEFVCWLTGNDWFKGKCYHGGSVINQCVNYETTEVDNGQCVAVEQDDNSGDNGGDNDESGGEDNGGTNTEGDSGTENTGKENTEKSHSGSGTSLWTRLSNVTGTKYTRENISLQDGLALYDRIMAEKRRLWDLRDK
jgi:hypothetical protein